MSAEYESQDFYVGNRHIHVQKIAKCIETAR